MLPEKDCRINGLRRTREEEAAIGILSKREKLIVCLMQFIDYDTPYTSGLRLIIKPVFIEKVESTAP